MAASIYNTLRWRLVRRRVLERDGHTCSISRLFGGDCSPPPLTVHHKTPVSQGGAPYDDANLLTACRRHHPQLEALRRALYQPEPVLRCPHRHPTRHGREACEARMRRERSDPVAA